VEVRCGDGYLGWPEHAPFDAILVAAAPDHVPEPLLDQLALGGRMILPVGESEQDLVLLRRTEQGIVQEEVLPVRFVPMTGMAEEQGK
jgi:protein-L-isoaspartate(D-aspartate) O-methyltransferase